MIEIGEMRQEENKKVNGGACMLRCGSVVDRVICVSMWSIIDALSESIAIYSVVWKRYFL